MVSTISVIGEFTLLSSFHFTSQSYRISSRVSELRTTLSATINRTQESTVQHIPHTTFCYNTYYLSTLVYPDGRVCISILHAPGDDPMGYESSAERWSPVQSVEKILLSVVSMLAGENSVNILFREAKFKSVKSVTAQSVVVIAAV